ncbi:hypothetical protein B0I37DRAFT_174268 [Chaetomium sp. MPI-CAGE-AT-0009]|nr:hypothetical protein B0I37DRAFT_174268 [Chaetomium sp. MPI-CAGE-AT-0009]
MLVVVDGRAKGSRSGRRGITGSYNKENLDGAPFSLTLIDFLAPGGLGSLSVEQELASFGPPLHCAESVSDKEILRTSSREKDRTTDLPRFWLNSAKRSSPSEYRRVTRERISAVVGSETPSWVLDPHVG